MSIKTTLDVHGLKELEDALNELGSDVAGKNGGLVRTALMSAALPVLRTAQAMAPKDEGDLVKSIKRSRVKEPYAYNELVTIGVPMPEWSGGKLVNKKQGGHGIFHEFGTKRNWKGSGMTRADYRSTKVGAKNAWIPPDPFLRPAIERNRVNSVNIFRTKLAAGIERAAKKIGNKNAAKVGARIKKL